MNRMIISLLCVFFGAAAASGADILVEAENFRDKGGWSVDQQFMDLMGSPYLLAHGLGRPVDDAVTSVDIPEKGVWHVYVRTFNWTSPWTDAPGPGRFIVKVNGTPLENELGAEGDRWMWQYAGKARLQKGEVSLALGDLTGFDGRCDAVYLTNVKGNLPPCDSQELASFRRSALGMPEPAYESYDFVVVGGGIAGMCTAVAAARNGASVALVNDRPVLGGNNSSEVRVHLGGYVEMGPNEGLGRMIREFGHERAGNAKPAEYYEDGRKQSFIDSQDGVTLYPCYRAVDVKKSGSHIDAVLIRHIETGEEHWLSAPVFSDCTGDGTIGALAGADFRMGREAREEYDESLAPEKADDMTMGASIQWYSKDMGRPTVFPEFEYGVHFDASNCEKVTMGEWKWETGMNLDQVADAERIRDYGLLVVYSNWSFLKNRLEDNSGWQTRSLDWVGYIAGKRESRRLLGDYVLTQNDIDRNIPHEDASFTTTWAIDLHFPDAGNSSKFPGAEFKAATVHNWIYPYAVPYRCLYSRNIDNLFMAGRNISVTHVALGTVRVMRTTGMMGEVVGMAASLCHRYGCSPREIYALHLDELKAMMKEGAGRTDGLNDQNFNLPNRLLDRPSGAGYSRLEGDTLVVGNRMIERKFVWNGGNLMTYSIENRQTGSVRKMASLKPDFSIAKGIQPGLSGTYASGDVPADGIHPPYHKAVVTYTLGSVQVRREYRVYADVPAIACDTWLKGTVSGLSGGKEVSAADRKNIESSDDMKTISGASVLDRLDFGGNHWHARAVEFWDVTDWNNNLVAERDIIAYRKNSYRGNLLFMQDGADGDGFFFLKEAPCSSTQLAYTGSDFTAEFGQFSVTSPGLSAGDISSDRWTNAYSCVTGVYDGDELSALKALRAYQKQLRRHEPGRDEMVMMNTWGDRSQDSKVNEQFCLAEIEKAARLGVTHFQIDDGWQAGKSPNSAVAKGSFRNIHDNPDYWTPDPVKYPRGLAPIVERGRQLGVEVGLWFNPSIQGDFEDWQKDADILVGLHEKYGIRVFKIDGLAIPSKDAEINLHRLFDNVLERTGNRVLFNLDATAGRRGGYFSFCEYGNIFLENRYTDWGNYYPYQTLRNLWMLSRYVPAERIQVEFLNRWRNAGKYGDDPFAPAQYDFEYLFAISMAGQPLAWMEASNLPEEAFAIGDVIRKYRGISADFHEGMIFPVGEEPSGRSWTGFQSIRTSTSGYMLVYRELTERQSADISTWLPEGAEVSFTPVIGSGHPFTAVTGQDGTIRFSLPGHNTYALYRYEVMKL
ncbi:MAG: FAD-dependent oxidoreductase [Bacteroides sp.]|nr:FAD-dependent oxidoreductase [Bacteroides sp.]